MKLSYNRSYTGNVWECYTSQAFCSPCLGHKFYQIYIKHFRAHGLSRRCCCTELHLGRVKLRQVKFKTQLGPRKAEKEHQRVLILYHSNNAMESAKFVDSYLGQSAILDTDGVHRSLLHVCCHIIQRNNVFSWHKKKCVHGNNYEIYSKSLTCHVIRLIRVIQ